MIQQNRIRTASALIFSLVLCHSADAAITHSFSDLNSATFYDLPPTGSNDPFGPLVIDVAGTNITVTSKEYVSGSTTEILTDPAYLGVFDRSYYPAGSFLAPIDSSVAPGSYSGEFETGRNIVLNFDQALSAVGATFMLGISGTEVGVRITAFDNLDNTGNSLGTVITPNSPHLGLPRPLAGDSGPFYFLYFVGIQADTASIRSLLIEPLDPTDGFALDGIALATSAVPVPAAAWLFGSGLLSLVGFARRKTA
ncbi:hypothetical protein MNBD_GAMMA25-120 [hydrothermal vent metagenome]|uniref:PEP-CTERM protein-sorting domain-containing protein n=1 Tax=hydrothermal vent metagenome TaxID=652676 RepID=A0A3B1BCB6_9ZZZZ